jgi:proteasome accessory factor B
MKNTPAHTHLKSKASPSRTGGSPKTERKIKRESGAAQPERKEAARPILERVTKLHVIWQGNWENPGRKWPTQEELAKELGVKVKTISRDIAFMRDRLHLPVDRVVKRGGYGYTSPVANLPVLQVCAGELMALAAALRIMELFKGTMFAKQMQSIVKKLTSTLREEMMLDFDRLSSVISFRAIGMEANLDPKVFETVLRAALEHEEVELDYCAVHGENAGIVRKRRVQPVHVGWIDNGCYVFADDENGENRRTFMISRASKVRAMGRHFKPMPFDEKKELDGSFGAFTNKPAETIRVRFADKAKQFVTERIWHSSQRFTKVMESEGPWAGQEVVEMKMKVAHTPDVNRFVLGWEKMARVMEPKSLVEAVREAGRGIFELYGPASSSSS